MKKVFLLILIILIPALVFGDNAPAKRKLTPQQMKANWRLIINDTVRKEKEILSEKLSMNEKQNKKANEMIDKLLKDNQGQIDRFINTQVAIAQEKEKNPNSPKIKKLRDDIALQQKDVKKISDDFKVKLKKILNNKQKKLLDEYVAEREKLYSDMKTK